MIGIINYGVGNIKAFENIYRKLYVPVKILSSIDDFDNVTHLILPGVGSFDHAMIAFHKSGMKEITDDFVLNKKLPVLGICVGMQMLSKTSEEGVEPGLCWIDGVVKKFDESKIRMATHLPHMGWNDLEIKNQTPLFLDFPTMAPFYFLHSYYFDCQNKDDIIAETEYGIYFTCAIQHNNIFGIQCHPEKSHFYGIKLLENFSKI